MFRNKQTTILKTVFLMAAIILAVSILLFALTGCNGEITSLTVKKENIILKLGGTIDLNDYVEKEGGGKLSYAAENIEVIELKGSKVTGKKEGEAAVVISGGKFVVRVRITVKDTSKVTISFPDTTATYNGGKFYITPAGNYPEGTEITYKCDGKDFYGATEAGIYEITASVKLPEGYVLDCKDATATLTIKKAYYDMSGITFSDKTFRYDGKEHVVSVSGVLPEGISVQYVNNKATDAGKYISTATFSGENPNYEKIDPMTCTYKIEPAIVSLKEKGLSEIKKTYNGESCITGVSGLPAGAEVKYYLYESEKYTECSAPPSFTEAGDYSYYIRIFADEKVVKNYIFTTENAIAEFKKDDGGRYVSDYLGSTVRISKATLLTGKLVLKNQSGEKIDSIPYGEKLTVGQYTEEGNVLIVEGDMPTGVKGEYEDRFSIVYTINGNADLDAYINPFGNLDSGIYIIKATYIMPEGYEKNYETLQPAEYQLRVNKATYDDSGIAYNSDADGFVYDGEPRQYLLLGVDENAVEVTYSIKRNGEKTDEVLHAGNYEIRASLKLKNDINNYNQISDKVIAFTVSARKIELEGIVFNNKKEVYDGKKVYMKTEGVLPENVSVKYYCNGEEGNAFTNAGTYTVEAVFVYSDTEAEPGDYAFYRNGIQIKALTAKLTIDKAQYSKDETALPTAESGLTYFYGMKLSDVKFTENENGFVQWKNPEEEIGNMTPTEESSTGEYASYAIYNADKANYYDYEYRVKITLKKFVINLEKAKIPDQFVGRNGSVYDNVYINFGASDYTKETVTKIEFTGTNTAKVTVEPEKPNNYVIEGETEYEVKIYVYDSNIYTYRKGGTVMTAYKGAATIITIPYGTTELSARMFDLLSGTEGRAEISKITIPETVVKLPENTFYGAKYLEEIVLETVDCAPELFRNLFGAEKPLVEVKVTVKKDTEIAERKFYGMNYLSELCYESPIVSIGNDALAGCSSLRKFVFDGTGIESIGENAFNGCVKLESLVLPSLIGAEGEAVKITYYFGTSTSLSQYSLSSISLISESAYEIIDEAFAYMTSLKRITLSSAVTKTGAYAFRNIGAAIDISGSGIKELANYAFASYLGESVLLPVGLTTIGACAFKDAVNLTVINLPSGVNTIGKQAFSGCAAEIVFEGDIAYTSVGTETFYGYLGKNVTLPSSVTSFGIRAFANSAVQTVAATGKITEIGEECFLNCADMEKYTVSSSVTKIGSRAFKGCGLLTEITFESITPPASATGVYDTGGGIITMKIKSGADKTEFKKYFEACGADGRYVFVTVS